MQTWMTIWTALLVVGGLGFVVMLVVVTAGAFGELGEALNELRQDTQESTAHPDSLDVPL